MTTDVVALVPAAGRGERLGAGIPKALVPVRGVPLLVHAVRALFNSSGIAHVVVSAPADQLAAFRHSVAEFGPAVQVVVGGAERSDSVRLALAEAVNRAPYARFALVHDAARAFTPPSLISTVIAALHNGQRAVIPVLPVVDTMRHIDESGRATDLVDRSTLRSVQTPQGFRIDLLRQAYTRGGSGSTDDAALVANLGEPIHTVIGHPYAMKITTPFDLLIAEAVLAKDVS